MFSANNSARFLSVLTILAIIFSFVNISPAAACASIGPPIVTTDASDYISTGVATISGSGFACGEVLSVLVTAPDRSTLSGDGTGSAGPDSVTIDGNGAFALSYNLSGTMPDGSTYFGQEGTYTVDVLNQSGAVIASTNFADSHFRFAHVTWRRLVGRTVEFTITTAWAISPGASWNFGDGFSVNYTGTQIASGPGYTVNRAIVTHTYAADGPYLAFTDTCCRISLVNSPQGSFRFETTVDLRNGNMGSPVSSIPVILQMAQGQVNMIPLPVSDPDGDPITCRLATQAESRISSQPTAGGNPLSVSSNCILTWNTSGTSVGQLWAAQVVLQENRNGSLNKVALDFIIRIVGGTANRAPSCMLNGSSTNTVNVGQAFSISAIGNDPDGGTLAVNHLGLPSGAMLSPVAMSSGTAPFPATFSWTPTLAAAGTSNAVSLTFTDPAGLESLCSFTVQVSAANQPPTASAGGSYQGNEGSAIAMSGATASDPDLNPLTYSWIVNSPLCSLDDDSALNPNLTCIDNGSFTAKLTVSDGTNPAVSSNATVNVANVAPSITISGAGSVNEGSSYTLTLGAVTEPGSDTLSAYIVHWGDGNTNSYASNGALTHTYTDGPNSYNITVDLTDEDGTFLDRANPLSVTVNNVAPSIAISGAGSVDEGSSYTLTLGAVTEPGSDTLSASGYIVHWDGVNTNSYASNGALTHTYIDGPNSYNITVDLTDEDGTFLDRANPLSVTVNNVAPVVAAPTWLSTVACRVPATLSGISFSDAGVDDDPWTVDIDWDDGSLNFNQPTNTQGAQSDQSHTYNTPGTYAATVTVADKDGGSGSNTNTSTTMLTVLQTYTIDFKQPLDNSTPSNLISNSMKNGRVVPVKVTLYDDCAQAYVTDPSAIVKIAVGLAGSGGGTLDAVESYSDAGMSSAGTNLFRMADGFWIYNLDSKNTPTPTGGTLAMLTNSIYRVDVYVNGVKATVTKFALLKPVK